MFNSDENTFFNNIKEEDREEATSFYKTLLELLSLQEPEKQIITSFLNKKKFTIQEDEYQNIIARNSVESTSWGPDPVVFLIPFASNDSSFSIKHGTNILRSDKANICIDYAFALSLAKQISTINLPIFFIFSKNPDKLKSFETSSLIAITQTGSLSIGGLGKRMININFDFSSFISPLPSTSSLISIRLDNLTSISENSIHSNPLFWASRLLLNLLSHNDFSVSLVSLTSNQDSYQLIVATDKAYEDSVIDACHHANTTSVMEVFGKERSQFSTSIISESHETLVSISSGLKLLRLASLLQILSNSPNFQVNFSNFSESINEIKFVVIAKMDSEFDLANQIIQSSINLYSSDNISITTDTSIIYPSWSTRSGCALIKFLKKFSKSPLNTTINSDETIISRLSLAGFEKTPKVEIGPSISISGEIEIDDIINYSHIIFETLKAFVPKF